MTVATTIGTVVAYLLVPMRSLGQDSWKIAAALMGRHIGGGHFHFSSYIQLINIAGNICIFKSHGFITDITVFLIVQLSTMLPYLMPLVFPHQL